MSAIEAMGRLAARLPMNAWVGRYNRQTFSQDMLAALIVTIMLIPQSLAYATLAGLPAHVGLYASIAPLVLYALFGTSRALAVGPVAVVSLMTAAAIAPLAPQGSEQYTLLAITLAFLSGLVLLAMGWLRLGFLANFLSHPVISAFITASAMLIALGQMKVLLNVPIEGTHFFNMLISLVRQWPNMHGLSAVVGIGALIYLFAARRWLKQGLMAMGLPARRADWVSKAAPVVGIALAAWLTWRFAWPSHGLKIVGTVPAGLPPITLPSWDPAVIKELALPALLIGVVGFVESVSVGQTLAAKRRQRIEPDRELTALGASNIGSALTGGFPVTGGFARSVVNFDAGAQTPAAGAFTAVGILLAALLLTPALYFVPQAVLAATIVVAVLSLIDFQMFRRTWQFAKADFFAATTTLLVTLGWGVEAGLIAGVLLSLSQFLYRTSRPHMAELGLVEGTEHFRNVLRHEVDTAAHVLILRVDESLYFANVRALEDRINDSVSNHPAMTHLVLQCSAINSVDASAIESLEEIDRRLRDAGITLHLSEVKGPVMDTLQAAGLTQHLSGQVFMSTYQALQTLAPSMTAQKPSTVTA